MSDGDMSIHENIRTMKPVGQMIASLCWWMWDQMNTRLRRPRSMCTNIEYAWLAAEER